MRHLDGHLARLARDAARLGCAPCDPDAVLATLRVLGEGLFADTPGVVRIDVHRTASPRLVGRPRPLTADPPTWRAIRVPLPHLGPDAADGAKRCARRVYDRAYAAARASGAEEALFFDAAGRLVEGAITALVALRRDGTAVTPPLARGGVRSVARDVLLAALPALREADLHQAELPDFRALVAVNAVRGARPIAALDGRGVGDGQAAQDFARELDGVLARDVGRCG